MVINLNIHWNDASGRAHTQSIDMPHAFPIPNVGDTLFTTDNRESGGQLFVKVDRRQFNYQNRGSGDLSVFVQIWCSLPPAPPQP